MRLREHLRSGLPPTIADHELLRPIAAGSYGDVWLCRNDLTGVFRALKIVWRDSFDSPKPYEREFEAIARFEPISRNHPGFVHILQTGRLPNGFYYIMELADDIRKGCDINVADYTPATLGEVYKCAPSVENAVKIVISLAESLSVLHSAELIHRDIKPSNVIFVGGQPKLADIGLVTAVSEAASIVGTNGFIAPEGSISPQSDLYSLGKLLYEICTGHDRLDFPRLPEGIGTEESLLLEVNQVLLKVCDSDPSKRYATAEAFATELRLLLDGKSIRRVRQLERTLKRTIACFTSILLVGTVAFAFDRFFQTRRSAEDRDTERRIATALLLGTEEVNSGDLLSALGYFANAALLDKRNAREHAIRLGTTAALAPEIIKTWQSDGEYACSSHLGNVLALRSGSTVRVLNAESGDELHQVQSSAQFLALDNKGDVLALAENQSLRLRRLHTGLEILIRFDSKIRHLSFADTGYLAVTTHSGSVYTVFEGIVEKLPLSEVFKAIFSSSGKYLALLGFEGGVEVFETQMNTVLPRRFNHDSIVFYALFLADEHTLITAGSDRKGKCWNISSGAQLAAGIAHSDAISFLAENLEGTFIATASLDSTVKLWRANTYMAKSQAHTLYHPSRVLWTRFAGASSLLSHCADGKTYLWNLLGKAAMFSEIRSDMRIPNKRLINVQGVHLLATNRSVMGTIHGKQIALGFEFQVETIAASKELIAVGTSDQSYSPHMAHIFDASGTPLTEIPHKDGITYVAFSRDGTRIVTCSEDFSASVWDVSTFTPLGPRFKHNNQVRWAEFSEDNQWLVTGSWDETVRIWNIKTGFPITPSISIGNLVEYVTFESPDSILAANSKRHYRISLPRFTEHPGSLLKSPPCPDDSRHAFF